MEAQPRFKNMRRWGLLVVGSLLGLLNPSQSEPVEGASLGGPSHIGTFEGSTTFTTSSSNGINPGLYLEVMDKYGNYTEYTSEDGVITLPDTQEGAYVTQAKLLGKTKYRDQDTGELLDQWEDGRNLTLESVQRPVLTMTGKNLFDANIIKGNRNISTGEIFIQKGYATTSDFSSILSNQKISFSLRDNEKYRFSQFLFYDENKNFISNSTSSTTTTPANAKFIHIGMAKLNLSSEFTEDELNELKDIIQVEYGNKTSYEPHKSNILTVNEPVELRGIGEVKDELNLLTGEVVERIGEYQITGEEKWYFLSSRRRLQIQNPTFTPNIKCGVFACDILQAKQYNDDSLHATGGAYYIGYTSDNWLRIILGEDLTSLEQGKEWLKANKPTIQYQLKTESIKTVGLNSTYSFQPMMNREVYISGTILPLVCSVTIPTEPLTFVLNPNAEADQQFIAPEFTITNHTPTSIYLELSRFEQLTQVLTDVLPEAHDDWSQLDRAQSKEMALALVPQPSAGWLALEEGPRYVAEDSNYYLGEVKANSSVDFTFTAHHGRAFVEALNPQYRLSFVFDFFDR